jgi:hypothetical protein
VGKVLIPHAITRLLLTPAHRFPGDLSFPSIKRWARTMEYLSRTGGSGSSIQNKKHVQVALHLRYELTYLILHPIDCLPNILSRIGIEDLTLGLPCCHPVVSGVAT